METRALAAALAEFGGSMCWSRDRRCAPRWTFWIVADGAVREFDGDLEDYRDWLAARNAGEQARRVKTRKAQTPSSTAPSARRGRTAPTPRRPAPLEARLAKVETEMEKLRAKLQALDATIADPDLYSRTPRRTPEGHGRARRTRQARMDELEEQWLQGSLEEIGQSEA